MQNISFPNMDTVSSTRIIYTPSTFARSSLIHLQETGRLQATYPHKNERSGLASCLFFTVLDGTGRLTYSGKEYELGIGDCVFIDCKGKYSHETPRHSISTYTQQKTKEIRETKGIRETKETREIQPDGGVEDRKEKSGSREVESVGSREGLWSLQWCHFYGPNMNAIYRKYQERGGQPVFRSSQLQSYYKILTELYEIASSDDYVRDMKIHEKLSSLLILLMEDAWGGQFSTDEPVNKSVDIQDIKEYLDGNFKQKLTIDDLASQFYINKYYLMSLFKERYGVTVNAYLNQVRVTYVKQNLRFTNKTVEMLAAELDIEPTYLSRLFKKIEGISPSEYRKQWSGNRDINQNKDET